MNIKLKRVIIGICVAILLLASLTVILLTKFNTNAQSVFKESYILGEDISVPSQTVNVDGVDVNADFYVQSPSGKISSSSSLSLNEAGKWTVNYFAKNNGKTATKQETFQVLIPLTSFSVETDNAQYVKTSLNSNVEGLIAKLSPSSEMTINSIIDLRKISGETDFISFYVMPNQMGVIDCDVIKVVLEDIYDPDNFIEITIRESVEVPEGQPDDSHAFIKARASTQRYAFGYEKGKKEGRPNGGSNVGDQAYGFYANSSFAGYNFGLEGYSFKLGYDYLTKTVHSWNSGYAGNDKVNPGTHVIDFDDENFSNKWNGFSSNYVRVKISADKYHSLSANVVITSLKGVAIHQSTVDTTSLSEIYVDYGIFDENNYPNAIVHKPYKVFDVYSQYSLYSKENISVSVYTGYGSSTMQNVPIVDGAFVPQIASTHTIVYTCTDAFGNSIQKLVPISVVPTADNITFNVDKSLISVNAGEYFDIPKISNVSGYTGEYKVSANICYTDGYSVDVSGKTQAKATRVGDATLLLTISDFVQNETSVEIPITIKMPSGPIIAEQPYLPIKYIVNGKYPVPAIKAEDYSSGSMVEIDCSVKIYSDNLNNEIKQQSGYFIASGNTIKLVYQAMDENGVSVLRGFDVPTVEVNNDGKIDKSKYFITENGNVLQNKNYVSFSAKNVSSARATFINELYGAEFVFEYLLGQSVMQGDKVVSYNKTDLDSVTIELKEVETDKKIRITIGKTIDNGKDKLSISVNGEKPVLSSDNTSFAGQNIRLELNNTKLKLSNTTINVDKYSDGSTFNGFSSNVIISVILDNPKDAEIRLVELFGQLMVERNRDMTKPYISIVGENQKEVSLNELVKISSAVAFDVLNPYSEIAVSVKNPNGEYAVSDNGVTLNKVDAGKSYTVEFTEYGNYVVEYIAIDGAGNKRTTSSIISCIDEHAPQILVGVSEISTELNKTVTIPEYKLSDNCTAEENIKVIIQVIDGEGVLSSCVDGKFVANKAGKWTIRIVAYDESYNLSYRDIICNVG